MDIFARILTELVPQGETAGRLMMGAIHPKSQRKAYSRGLRDESVTA